MEPLVGISSDEENETPNTRKIWKSMSFNEVELKNLGVAVLPSYSSGMTSFNASDLDPTSGKMSKLPIKRVSLSCIEDTKRHKKICMYPKDMFLTLSDELVLHIFSFFKIRTLGLVAQVNKRFRRIAYDDSLWTKLDMSKVAIPKDLGCHLLHLGVKYLQMSESRFLVPAFSNDSVLELKDFKSKVSYLNLSEAYILLNDLEIFSLSWYNLKKLSLEGCDLNEKVLVEISKNLQLDTLNLALCSGITSDGVHSIVQNCSELESLNVSWTGLDEQAVFELVNGISIKLKEINLSGHDRAVKDEGDSRRVVFNLRKLFHVNMVTFRCENEIWNHVAAIA